MNSMDSSGLRGDVLFGVKGLVAVITGGGSGESLHLCNTKILYIRVEAVTIDG